MNTKFCGKCGASNEAQMVFCSQCGTQFENARPVNNYSQPVSSFSPDLPPAPNYPAQQPFQQMPPQPTNNFPANQNNFQPPNFTGGNNFNAPNTAFQQPFQQNSPPAAFSAPIKKSGIGSKILSALGALAVGIFVLLKFGLVMGRAGRLGGIGLVAIVFLVIVALGVFSFIRKS